MSTINEFSIDCAAQTCSSPLGAASNQDQFCPIDVSQSEIDSLIIVHPTLGTLVTNWGAGLVLGDFDIDNTDATDVKQKRFFGVGSLGEPEISEVTLNNFQPYPISKTYPLTFEITQVSLATRDYFRKIECNKIKPLIYYTDVDGFIHGGATGIQPTRFDVSMPMDSGQEGIQKILLSIQWKAKTSPDRYVSPLV